MLKPHFDDTPAPPTPLSPCDCGCGKSYRDPMIPVDHMQRQREHVKKKPKDGK